jgi:hypothetical protein
MGWPYTSSTPRYHKPRAEMPLRDKIQDMFPTGSVATTNEIEARVAETQRIKHWNLLDCLRRMERDGVVSCKSILAVRGRQNQWTFLDHTEFDAQRAPREQPLTTYQYRVRDRERQRAIDAAIAQAQAQEAAREPTEAQVPNE